MTSRKYCMISLEWPWNAGEEEEEEADENRDEEVPVVKERVHILGAV